VIENLRILAEAKRRLGSSKPFVFIRMLVNRYNESQIEEMRRLAESIGVDAFTVGVLYVDIKSLVKN
jgi:MoaA/NifB/PqqE/SkfB family radical SAM enzyme